MVPDFRFILVVLIFAAVIAVAGAVAGTYFTRKALHARRAAVVVTPGAPTNTVALVSFIAAFVAPIAGVVAGHIALNQLKTRAEAGWALAVAALWIGYAAVYLFIVYFIAWLSFAVQMFSHVPLTPVS